MSQQSGETADGLGGAVTGGIRDLHAGIDLLEGLADRRRARWSKGERALSDRCEGWLADSQFAIGFFMYIGANPGVLPWVVRAGKKYHRRGWRVSGRLLHEMLRAAGEVEVAGGAPRFPNVFMSPLSWAVAFAYPDLALAWGLELQGPREASEERA